MNDGLVFEVFWNGLDSLLDANGITLKQLCEALNISYGSMRATRSKGLAPSNLELIIQIAKYFNVPVDFLLTGNKTADLPADVLQICLELCKLDEIQRQPVIKLIEGQIDFWKKTFNK